MAFKKQRMGRKKVCYFTNCLLYTSAAQMSFETIVGTGERSALPHGRPTGRKIRAHEPILMDFGIQYKNYQSDMTRVCFIGKPQPKIASIYHICLLYTSRCV